VTTRPALLPRFKSSFQRPLMLTMPLLFSGPLYAADVVFTIDADQSGHAISPLIYGTNSGMLTAGTENPGFFRIGGNRFTGYNWENNFSSAGDDWNQVSDAYLVPDGADPSVPAIVLTDFIDHQAVDPARALVTLQMAGYVAADGNGSVSEGEQAPSERWKKVLPQKNTAISPTPDTSDAAVYMDELVSYLVDKYGTAEDGGVLAYSLDNEPGLWSKTHPRIHKEKITADELLSKSIALSSAIKSVDSSARVFGAAFYGFTGYQTLEGAEDWPSGQYRWFIDYYLDSLRQASAVRGERLLDVLDIHWYSEAKGDSRIVFEGDAVSAADRYARVQAPRTLWDEQYLENSWIAQYRSEFLPLLPQLQQSIDSYYSGTRLAITEYNFGGGNDISGGLAQADTLGIFGKYNVYAANLWVVDNKDEYQAAAFRLFRNYDGNNRTFGDTSLSAATSDNENTSVYSATDSASGDLHIIVLNKSFSDSVDGRFTINTDEHLYDGASAWAMTSAGTQIVSRGSFDITDNGFSYTLPAASGWHFVLTAADDADDSGDADSDDSGSGDSGSDDSGSDDSGSDDSGSGDSGSDDSGSDDSGSDDSGSDDSGSDDSGSGTDNGDSGADDADDTDTDPQPEPSPATPDDESEDSSGGSSGGALSLLLLSALLLRRRPEV